MNKLNIFITVDGTMRFVCDDAIADLGLLGERKRASDVEPAAGGWEARMHDGTSLGVFKLRKDAVAAEIQYLNEKECLI